MGGIRRRCQIRRMVGVVDIMIVLTLLVILVPRVRKVAAARGRVGANRWGWAAGSHGTSNVFSLLCENLLCL